MCVLGASFIICVVYLHVNCIAYVHGLRYVICVGGLGGIVCMCGLGVYFMHVGWVHNLCT